MACLGLSQQFGVGGVTNFGFIIFQAAGGYAAAILALPADSRQRRVPVLHRRAGTCPSRVPWIGAAVVGGVIALPFTFLVGRRLRGDFAAVGLLVTAVLLNLLVTNYRPLLNGDAGLSLIPQPLQGEYNPTSAGYEWIFAAGAIVCCALRLLARPPDHRVAVRPLAARHAGQRLGRRLARQEPARRCATAMLVTGGAIAGLSGGILVSYITTWSPAAWGYAETVVLFAAVIIGGAGNHLGRRARRDPGAGRLRGGDPVHPDLQQPAAEPDPVAGVGGDRAADRDLPVAAAAGHPAGAQAGHQGARAGPAAPAAAATAAWHLRPAASAHRAGRRRLPRRVGEVERRPRPPMRSG